MQEHDAHTTGTFTVTLTITNPGGSDSASAPIAVTAQVTPSLNEDWEGYEIDNEPTFWMDHEADGDARTAFRVLLAGDNRAFGADYEAGTNLFSAYALPGVASWQDYEVRGRLQRTDANGSLGVVVYSRYPAAEQKMYMLSHWPGGSFALGDHGTGVLIQGDLDAGVAPATSTWYRFRVQAVTHDDRVTLRAKVWVDGETEPTLWQAEGYASSTLNAGDEGAGRITAGSVGVHEYDDGIKYVDDLVVDPLGIQSDFSGSPITGTAPLTVTFTDGSTGTVDGRLWTFGDGSTLLTTGGSTSATNPSHTYTQTGAYTVSLAVTATC